MSCGDTSCTDCSLSTTTRRITRCSQEWNPAGPSDRVVAGSGDPAVRRDRGRVQTHARRVWSSRRLSLIDDARLRHDAKMDDRCVHFVALRGRQARAAASASLGLAVERAPRARRLTDVRDYRRGPDRSCSCTVKSYIFRRRARRHWTLTRQRLDSVEQVNII